MASLLYCVFLVSFFWLDIHAKNVQLEQNGFNGVTIYISPSVDESKWTSIERNIKQAFEEGSVSLYYGSNSRAFFRNIQIVLPMSWNTKETKQTFSSMDADIAIENLPTSLYGNMPYIDQARICRVEGDRINFPLSFFENLVETTERIGAIGTLILKQWMSYRYGIFEEIGFPMDPVYPSAYCAEQGGSPIAVSCSNVPLNINGFASIRGSSFDDEDCKCNKEEYLENCMYVVGQDQDPYLLSSIMGFSQIPSNTVFCDSEYYPHESEHPSIHNALCQKQPTFDTVLKHYDYAYGHNPPNFVPDTAPNFDIFQQALRIRIVLDTKQKRDFGNKITEETKKWFTKEQKKGVDFGPHLFASGGKYWRVDRIPFDKMTEILFTPPSTSGEYDNLKWAIGNATEELASISSPNFPSYIILISDGVSSENMLDATDNDHVHVVAIDTNENSTSTMKDISKNTGGYYFHAGPDVFEIIKALKAFTSTFSFNDEDWIKLDCEVRKTLVYDETLSNIENVGSRIIAKAFRGGNPIVKANVIAMVNGQEVPLSDLGDGDKIPADSIAGDGVYTAWLPDILGDEHISVECKMEIKPDSFSHSGFETDYDEVSANLHQPFCCGSLAPEPKQPNDIEIKTPVSAQSAFYKQ